MSSLKSPATRHRLLSVVSGVLLIPALAGACLCVAVLYVLLSDFFKHAPLSTDSLSIWWITIVLWSLAGLAGTTGYVVAWWRFVKRKPGRSLWVTISLLIGILAAVPLAWITVDAVEKDITALSCYVWSIACILQAGVFVVRAARAAPKTTEATPAPAPEAPLT